MEKLKKLCEAALSSGVRVTRENLFDLARFGSYSNRISLENICIKLKWLKKSLKIISDKSKAHSSNVWQIIDNYFWLPGTVCNFCTNLTCPTKYHFWLTCRLAFFLHKQCPRIYYIIWHTCRLAGEFSCLQPAAGNLLTKCSKFLRSLITMMITMMMPLLFKIGSTLNTVHLRPGKNCPKTLGSFATLIGKTLRHSRCFLSSQSCPIYNEILFSSLQN